MHRTFVCSMLLLSEKDVRRCLDMKTCIDVNRKALIAIANGSASVPSRLALPYIPPPSTSTPATTTTTTAATDWTLFKPASLVSTNNSNNNDATTSPTSTTTQMGMKIVSVRSQNPDKYNLPLVPATVLHINPITGIVDAVVAGTYLTAARTAAGSALSVELMFNRYRKNDHHRMCHTITIFGAGMQAETHIHAITTILGYPICNCIIINRSYNRAQQLSNIIKERNYVQNECTIVLLNDTNEVHKALSISDCIITTTNTMDPLWQSNNNIVKLKNGCHIIGIGSYTPDMMEVPNEAVNQCQNIYIDTNEARDVGDLKHLKKNNNNGLTIQLLGEALLLREQQQQQQNDDNDSTDDDSDNRTITFYKAVGTAIQDVLTVDAIVQRARELQIGIEIDMT